MQQPMEYVTLLHAGGKPLAARAEEMSQILQQKRMRLRLELINF